ncbi:metal-dependent hydrolase (plasmid) [Rossellomorea sp. AcN35-11]|nr:metal-dependent hydrolase [Rossellomorea aquimaris]WJV32238.1 metal-dependent hydrolase [Rossellomorea sp. AcN35-11]
MLAKTHSNFGVAFGLSSVYLMESLEITAAGPLLSAAYVYFVYKGSGIPDIDHPTATISKRYPILSKVISKLFGHRKFTHSLLFILLFSAIHLLFVYANILGLTYLVNRYLGIDVSAVIPSGPLKVSLYLSFGLAVGMLSHVVGDSLTKRGVQILRPFSKKSYKLPFTFKTGSLVESVLSMLFVIFNVFMLMLIIYRYLLGLTYNGFSIEYLI